MINQTITSRCILLLCLLNSITSCSSFTISRTHGYRRGNRYGYGIISASPLDTDIDTDTPAEISESTAAEEDIAPTKISSPLKYMAQNAYPAISLKFPSLSTSSQRERNITGIALDFIIDTAANTNTINGQVATELQCERVGSALPGYGAAGAIRVEDGNEDLFLLGDCSLDIPNINANPNANRAGENEKVENEASGETKSETKPEADIFMTNLTAAALPVASPAAAGLLGVAFLNCFEGGVQFDWGGGIDGRSPTVTFHAKDSGIEEQLLTRMKRVELDILDEVLLPTVAMTINGVQIPALLDTGSPVTVLNSAAAEIAGLQTISLENESDNNNENDGNKKKKGLFNLNPFQKISDNFKAAQSMSEAVSRGDILVVMGPEGRIELKRTIERVTVRLGSGSDDGQEEVQFPKSSVFVGDLPGLKALEGLKTSNNDNLGDDDNDDSSSSPPPPAAILGMDVLKRLPMMVYRGVQSEVYF